MKQFLKIITTLVFASSFLALIWINTGNHKESGYTYCNGEGFIPKSSLISTPGGICLGTPIRGESVSGRYDNKGVLNNTFGAALVLSALVYLLLQRNKISSKH
jgi:hypothetical protein